MSVRIIAMTLLVFFTVPDVKAADTTWVQAHSNIWLPSSPKNLDTTIAFPTHLKSFRKILMIFTLGKYQCPGNPQYCGDWDYTVQNFIMTPKGDTVELGRLITPYANASSPRTPWSWKERYVFDVTDYYPLLADTATVRIHYSGYSGGFTADVKFAMIDGTPPRNVLNIERLWHGSFRYGDTTGGGIEAKIPALNLVSDNNAKYTELKFNVTGHGSDDNGCSEFCRKKYVVMVNKALVGQQDIWRDDCGLNHLYPQTGTWVYDRGNWCPGDLVHTNTHKLSVGSAAAYELDVDFEQYMGSVNNPNTSWGSYIIDAAVIDYGNFNKQLDASLEDILAPNDHEMHFRDNPLSGRPIVRVKNTGATAINSIKISYSVGSSKNYEYTWHGGLPSLETVDITMPEPFALRTATGSNNAFKATIVQVNGKKDDDGSNDELSSVFTAAPQWPTGLVIKFKTNNSTVNGKSETNWYLIEADNDTVARRENNSPGTSYQDTIHIGPSYYRLVVTDAGCDGLNWWANQGAGTGNFSVTKLGDVFPISLNGYYNGDFGCGFTQHFNVNWPTAITNIDKSNNELLVYPNPAQNNIQIKISTDKQVNGRIIITDAVGRIVFQKTCNSATEDINISSLSNGLYTIRFIDNESAARLQTRFVIAK